MFPSRTQALNEDPLRSTRTWTTRALDAMTVCACIGAGLLLLWQLGLRDRTFPDWTFEARSAADALLSGHLVRFLSLAPVYGASLLLRAPFMFAAKLWHGADAAVYGASALPCVAAMAALAVWLGRRARAAGAGRPAQGVVILLCLANPLAVPALQFGHPEDLLGAVLCIAALLSARGGRAGLAGALLGLAIANKEWAVLALGPVLLALPHRRILAAAVTGAVAGALVAPFLLGGSSGFVAQGTAVGLGTGTTFQPWEIWWFLGTHTPHGHGWRAAPAWVAGIGHLLVVAVMPPLSALHLWWRRRGDGGRYDLVLFLALLLALRCLLDPWDISYYSLPVLLTLLTWEVLSFPRLPVVSLSATLVAWLVYGQLTAAALHPSPDAQALIFLLVGVPAVAAVAMALYRPIRPKAIHGRADSPTGTLAAVRRRGPKAAAGEATTGIEPV